MEYETKKRIKEFAANALGYMAIAYIIGALYLTVGPTHGKLGSQEAQLLAHQRMERRIKYVKRAYQGIKSEIERIESKIEKGLEKIIK